MNEIDLVPTVKVLLVLLLRMTRNLFRLFLLVVCDVQIQEKLVPFRIIEVQFLKSLVERFLLVRLPRDLSTLHLDKWYLSICFEIFILLEFYFMILLFGKIVLV